MIDLNGHLPCVALAKRGHRRIGNAMRFPNCNGRSDAPGRVNRKSKIVNPMHPFKKPLCSYVVNFRNITSANKNPRTDKQDDSLVTTCCLEFYAVSAHWRTSRFPPKSSPVSYCSPAGCEEIKPNISKYSDFGPPRVSPPFYPLFEPVLHRKPLSLLHFHEFTNPK